MSSVYARLHNACHRNAFDSLWGIRPDRYLPHERFWEGLGDREGSAEKPKAVSKRSQPLLPYSSDLL